MVDEISFEWVLDLYGWERPEGLPLTLLKVLAAQTPIVGTGVVRVGKAMTGGEVGRLAAWRSIARSWRYD